jgi:UDPglucose 6-dehydrogenase
MKFTIAGYGYVGKAHYELFKDYYDIEIYDPALGYETIDHNISGMIICVATPQGADGSCDMSNVIDVIQRTPKECPILIKSTISLEGWKLIKKTFPKKEIAFSPEFLRTASAIEDVKNLKEIWLGGDNYSFWSSIYVNSLGFVSVRTANPEELILSKYFRNSFLALKVSFFNQAYDLCEKLGLDFESVRSIIVNDTRIGESHSLVTEERGFGGHCFPKDTQAIIETAKQNEFSLSLIEEAVRYNKGIKNE